jgi:DNA-binding HxlR family transcriptional regulator
METHEESSPFCPYYHRAVELIGRRWTGAILRALLSDVGRFSELTETIPGLSDRMLSERLKELESEGIVVRRVIPETPVRIEYHLTAKGRALGSVVTAVSCWAQRWLELRDDCDADHLLVAGAAVEFHASSSR